MKNIIFIAVALLSSFSTVSAQNHSYYLRSVDSKLEMQLKKEGATLQYLGNDKNLKRLFEESNIFEFKKAFKNAKKSSLHRTYYMESDNPNISKFITENLQYIFDFIEFLPYEEAELLYYPNDYGLSGGANLGLPIHYKYLDFIKTPDAWNYVPNGGISEIKIGISDSGPININDSDFLGKVTILPNENTSQIDHGTNVTAMAAARGDNGYAGTGVCYNCDIIKNGYGNIQRIVELYEAGARIINCSWTTQAFSPTSQEIINAIAADSVIIVASSGNLRGSLPNAYGYPASYENVISVGAVGSGNDLDCSNIVGNEIYNVKNYLAGITKFFVTPNCNLSLENQVYNEIQTMASLNDKVDIVAPGSGHFRHYQSVMNNSPIYGAINDLWTSPAAPLVSGTIGLMLSVNQCLSFLNVDSILKLTSTYIEDIPANQVASGYFGSGTINSFKAVEFTFESKSFQGNAVIQNQDFSRFKFDLQNINHNLTILNQTFRDNNTSNFVARNSIEVLENSDFKPNQYGFIDLKIDESIDISCSALNFSKRSDNKEKRVLVNAINSKLYPNPNSGNFSIVVGNKEVKNLSIMVFDILGKPVFQANNIPERYEVNLPTLASGLYFVKLSGDNYNETLKFVKK